MTSHDYYRDMKTHQVIDTGWCNEHKAVAFEGTEAECRAYLADNGQQDDYVRRIPGAEKARKAQAERAAMLASFGVVYVPRDAAWSKEEQQ